MKYLLPCRCGQQAVVDSSQAGQRIPCACGRTLDVPTIRGLRQLALAADENPVGRPRWSGLQGGLFVAGLLVMVGGALAAASCWYQTRHIDVMPPDVGELDRLVDQAAEKLNNAQLLDLMREYEKRGLVQPSSPPAFLVNRRQLDRLWSFTYGFSGVAVAGALCAMAAVTVCRRPATR